jgi:hypothetical protein
MNACWVTRRGCVLRRDYFRRRGITTVIRLNKRVGARWLTPDQAAQLLRRSAAW